MNTTVLRRIWFLIFVSLLSICVSAHGQTQSLEKPTKQIAEEQKMKEMQGLLSEIQKRIEANSIASPRKRYISPSTRDPMYSDYYLLVSRKIEEYGTNNFPFLKEKKLYGQLLLILTVNHDGRVLSTEIVESSGQAELDKQARKITREAGPFSPFSPEMRKLSDQVVLVSRFNFTNSEVEAPQPKKP
jgi:periplasmic protein TonB